MKKILFATTALIATASVAAADVRISGYGRFGFDYNSDNDRDDNGVSQSTITSRLRIQFDVSTETDGGVGFNARLRAQGDSRDNNNGGSDGNIAFNGARFGVSYGPILVNVGNIIGAVENAPGLYRSTRSADTGIDGMGFYGTGIQGASWDAYSSGGVGANGVEVLYSANGFVGHLSWSQNNETFASGNSGGEDRVGVMATYSFGDYFVSGAYQDSNFSMNDIVFLAAGGNWGDFGAILSYADVDAGSTVVLEGSYDFGAVHSILGWVNNVDAETGTGASASMLAIDGTSWGVNYQYDLGGGATFVAGFVDSADDVEQFQAGVYFSF